jgi:hypothetical protein
MASSSSFANANNFTPFPDSLSIVSDDRIIMIHRNGFPQLLSAGIICLLVGGTLAAKAVFLVDNDLEHKTELNSENWYLDASTAQTATGGIEQLAYNYIHRLTQLPDRKAWCGSAQEISLVLAKAKSLRSIEVNNLSQGKADIIVKLPNLPGVETATQPSKNLHLYVNPAAQSNNAAENWCISAGK